MAPSVQRIQEIGQLVLGEGPHWDAENQCLYFIDIRGKSIHRYVPSTKQHTKAKTDSKVSFIIPIKNTKNKFVITQNREIVVINWDGVSENVSVEKRICEIDEGTDNSLNDGKADPSGRLWTGSLGEIGEIKGRFISLEKGKVTTHFTEVGISNGLAFNVAAKKLYYIDTIKLTVDQFDFDIKNGTVSNRESVFSLAKLHGPSSKDNFYGPDGMTIDTDGNLWVAVFNKSKVIKIDPRKPETLLETISLPAKQVTSVNFGGPNLDELYITTGRAPIGEQKIDFSPEDGSVFKVTGLGVKGFAGDTVVL